MLPKSSSWQNYLHSYKKNKLCYLKIILLLNFQNSLFKHIYEIKIIPWRWWSFCLYRYLIAAYLTFHWVRALWWQCLMWIFYQIIMYGITILFQRKSTDLYQACNLEIIETTLLFAVHYALRYKLEKYIIYLALYLELIILLGYFLLFFPHKRNDKKKTVKITNHFF